MHGKRWFPLWFTSSFQRYLTVFKFIEFISYIYSVIINFSNIPDRDDALSSLVIVQISCLFSCLCFEKPLNNKKFEIPVFSRIQNTLVWLATPCTISAKIGVIIWFSLRRGWGGKLSVPITRSLHVVMLNSIESARSGTALVANRYLNTTTCAESTNCWSSLFWFKIKPAQKWLQKVQPCLPIRELKHLVQQYPDRVQVHL